MQPDGRYQRKSTRRAAHSAQNILLAELAAGG
jgi:hypothetical protein